MVRLDQFLRLTLFLSRREAQRLLRAKAIDVNGEIIVQGRHLVDSAHDQIRYQGELLQYDNSPSYFVLNKPAGYVSSHHDDGYPSLFRLLEYIPDNLHIAGRLDADTTGLVLLTDDGDFSHYITHPKRQISKCYYLTLAETMEHDAIQQLERGVMLRGESEITLPAKVIQHDSKTISLTIREGRYHQVKRMLAAVGNRVVSLHRYQIGTITLDGLESGEYRILSKEELESFYE